MESANRKVKRSSDAARDALRKLDRLFPNAVAGPLTEEEIETLLAVVREEVKALIGPLHFVDSNEIERN